MMIDDENELTVCAERIMNAYERLSEELKPIMDAFVYDVVKLAIEKDEESVIVLLGVLTTIINRVKEVLEEAECDEIQGAESRGN